MARLVIWSSLLAGVILSVASAHAQVQPNIENGFKSYGSYDASSIENINLSNGGLTIRIPLPLAYPQRGGKINPSYFLVSNSKSWQVQYSSNSHGPVYYWNYGPPLRGGYMAGLFAGPLVPYVANTLQIAFTRHWVSITDIYGNVTAADGSYRIRDWDGSVHQLADVSGGNRTAFESSDTSGFYAVPSNFNLTYGTPDSITITDRRGMSMVETCLAAGVTAPRSPKV